MNELEPEIQQPENSGELTTPEITQESVLPTPPQETIEALVDEEDELLLPREEEALPEYHAMDLEGLLTHLGDSVKKANLEG
ncbi:MAG: hypothetical protein RIS78_474, partial [Bacteroidota bacterium]